MSATTAAEAPAPAELEPVVEPANQRRWLGRVILAICVLVALRLLAPWVLAPILAARLGTAIGATVAIDDLELGLLGRDVAVHGLHVVPLSDSASHVHVEAIEVHVRLHDLLRGAPSLEVVASGLAITLDVRRPWPGRPERERTRSGLLRSLDVTDGELMVTAADTPPFVALTGLRARLDDTSFGARSDAMSMHYTIEAETGDGGSLAVEGSFAPVAPAASWTLQFALERFDLRRLNPVFESVFEMDVEQGWFSLAGQVTVGLGRMRGRVHPRFEELELLGRGEKRVRHPMAEALFTSMLSGADLPIDLDQAAGFTGDAAVDELVEIDGMQVLSNVVLRGFTRRLDSLDGYVSSVGGIEVDFPAGRMSFFDVQLERKGGEIESPFVAVDQLDIVVDQTAIQHGVPTYKSITLHRPKLVFVTGTSPERSQLNFDPDWQEKLSVLPYVTDRVEIIDGRVEYRDETKREPTALFASGVQLKAVGLGRGWNGEVRRSATLRGSARFMDLSTLTLEAEFSPGSVPLDGAVRLGVETLELAQLNELLHGRFGIDISTGTMALTADFDAHDGAVSGAIAPVIRNVRVLGEGETELQHPIRELMLERRLRKLDGAALQLDYRIRFNLMRELPGALLSAALNAEPVPKPKRAPMPWVKRRREQ